MFRNFVNLMDRKIWDGNDTKSECHDLTISFLFQARKTEDNVQAICDKCNALKVSQIIKLLNSYTPSDETEERVTPAFVRKIQAKLADKAATENSQELLMPQRSRVAIKFPFCPSNIQLEELDIPEFYNGLTSLLKKM